MSRDEQQDRLASAERALAAALRSLAHLRLQPAPSVGDLRRAQEKCRDAESAIEGALIDVERASRGVGG